MVSKFVMNDRAKYSNLSNVNSMIPGVSSSGHYEKEERTNFLSS